MDHFKILRKKPTKILQATSLTLQAFPWNCYSTAQPTSAIPNAIILLKRFQS